MSCGDGRPPSLGIVACIAPAPGPTNKMPLITTMLRSFRKTVSRGDLQALGGRTCLYLCANDRDKMLLEHVRDVQHQAQTPSLNIIGVRVFFYPSISLYPSSAKTVSGGSTMSAFREAFVQAYADGAEYFHHTFEDVEYTRAGWMRGAKRWLNKSVGRRRANSDICITSAPRDLFDVRPIRAARQCCRQLVGICVRRTLKRSCV